MYKITQLTHNKITGECVFKWQREFDDFAKALNVWTDFIVDLKSYEYFVNFKYSAKDDDIFFEKDGVILDHRYFVRGNYV